MARPERKDVDYFPHKCVHGEKMFVIEHKFGNDGYAIWMKILEKLGSSSDHYLDLRKPMLITYLASHMNVSEQKLRDVLLELANLDAINKELFTDHLIVWSDKFVESIQDAYIRRRNECITLTKLLNDLNIQLRVNVLHKHNNGIEFDSNNTQSKVKQSKVKQSKVYGGEKPQIPKSKEFVPPSFEEVEEFLKQKNCGHRAREIFDYYNDHDWKDRSGTKVKNWKQKIQGAGWLNGNSNSAPKKSNKVAQSMETAVEAANLISQMFKNHDHGNS